ncbi:tetraspanin 34 [Girardinichthys multiradiatus]|uniref:tetraspanin 34 n=1 Tax=Girardinichthys multiradiatus TaxID=208333 RepID=UPI001FADFD59|nr:tetraspanin 34 [Girardinichthys multiradiatus]
MCNGILKIMMFIFNGVIFLAGVAILGVGVWVTVDSDSLLGLLDGVEDLPDEVFRLAYVGYVMIGVGAALLVIGFLGCCGAIMENRCMLLTFFSVVLIIFLIEVAGAVVLFVFDDVAEDIFDNLEDEVRKTIQKNYGEDEKMTSLWNATMEQFECCGYKNYTDFDDSPFNRPEDNYPSPCCSGTMVVCSSHNAALLSVPGCFVKLVDWLEENSVIIAGVAMGVAALEIAAMVVSMILYCNAGRKS